jgi:hypothetical protein
VKVRLLADEPRLVVAIQRVIEPDEVFEVPDGDDREWDIPGLYEVITTPAKDKE